MKIAVAALLAGCAAMMFVAVAQYSSVRHLREEVALLKSQMAVPEHGSQDAPATTIVRQSASPDSGVGARVAALEARMEDLSRTSDYLMERGQAPLTRLKADAMIQNLLDPAAPDRDKARTVRLLVQNGMFDDTAAGHVASLLPSLTDAAAKRTLLDSLQGATNSILKTPLMQLAADIHPDVRERAILRLGAFAGSADVQQQLWSALRDEDNDVRRSAQSLFRRLPPDEGMLAEARRRGLGQESTVFERLTALQVLQNGKQDLPELAGSLAQAAMDPRDPDLRLSLLRGFDQVPHPSFLQPLVQGLQDPDPRVRHESADALSHYRDNPTAREWLQYAAQNDADPSVRHEAGDSLRGNRRGR